MSSKKLRREIRAMRHEQRERLNDVGANARLLDKPSPCQGAGMEPWPSVSIDGPGWTTLCLLVVFTSAVVSLVVTLIALRVIQ